MAQKKMTAQQKKAAAEKQKKEQKIIMIVAAVLAVALIAVMVIVLAGSDWSFTSTTSGGNTSSDHVHSENCNHGPEVTRSNGGDGATLETAKATHYVTIEIENYGTLKGELYGNTTPYAVEQFVSLAQSGFYDGLTFHRIIEGFMMQGGAPNADSPDVEEIQGEFAENGIENNLLHEPGVLSMARTSVPDSATSQFFIMHEKYPSLDGKYAAFGRITEGLDIVDKICTEAVDIDGNGGVAEEKQPVIKTITVTEA